MLKVNRILTVLATALASVALAASPAAAAPPYVNAHGTTGANLRACAGTSCAIIGWMPNQTAVSMICWWDGASATGNYTSRRWFKIANGGSSNALIHSSLVERQVAVRQCATGHANDGWDRPGT